MNLFGMLEKWALIALIGIALFFTGMIRGCVHERDKWEAASAKAEAEAATETARRVNAQADKVRQYEKERDNAKLAAARANDAVRGLRDTIANMPRNTALVATGAGGEVTGELLGTCAERYTGVAAKADEYHAKASLCGSIYDSLSNRDKVKNFIKEAK